MYLRQPWWHEVTKLEQHHTIDLEWFAFVFGKCMNIPKESITELGDRRNSKGPPFITFIPHGLDSYFLQRKIVHFGAGLVSYHNVNMVVACQPNTTTISFLLTEKSSPPTNHVHIKLKLTICLNLQLHLSHTKSILQWTHRAISSCWIFNV